MRPHVSHLHLIPLLAGLLAAPVTASAADSLPVTDRFPVTIGGQERSMARYRGSAYLILTKEDAGNPEFLAGEKDVAFTGKIVHIEDDGNRVVATVHPFANIPIRSPSGLWADRKEGDNIHLFGHLSFHPGTDAGIVPVAVLPATSDADLLASRFSGIPTADYARRLEVAQRLREESHQQSNEEYWLSAADRAIDAVIADSATQAERDQDLGRLEQAVIWSVDLLHDPTRAARIAAAPWARTLGGPRYDAIARRLRGMGFEFYRDQWRPRAEALAMEFEDRFTAIPWRDANAYYRLGRWTEARAELLPQAVEYAHRCYDAGLKADPNHPGCRSALGLSMATVDGLASSAGNAFTHGGGTTVAGPSSWRLNPSPVEGDASWSDPASETAYVAVTISPTPQQPVFNDEWQTLLASQTQRSDFQSLGDEEIPSVRQARCLTYQYRDGDAVRHRMIALAIDGATTTAVRITAGYEPEEKDTVRAALRFVAEHIRFPATLAKPAAKP